jgi:hypothetical protein
VGRRGTVRVSSLNSLKVIVVDREGCPVLTNDFGPAFEKVPPIALEDLARVGDRKPGRNPVKAGITAKDQLFSRSIAPDCTIPTNRA